MQCILCTILHGRLPAAKRSPAANQQRCTWIKKYSSYKHQLPDGILESADNPSGSDDAVSHGMT